MSDSVELVEFAAMVLERLRREFPEVEFVYRESDHSLRSENEDFPVIHYLDNMCGDYNAATYEEKGLVLDRLVSITGSSVAGRFQETTFLGVAERLLPRVIDRPYVVQTDLMGRLQAARGESKGGRLELAVKEWAGNHVVGLVIDEPDSMRYVTVSDLEKWEVDFEEAYDYAVKNLEIVSEEGLEAVFPGVWQSPWKDNHDASRVVVDGVIEGADVIGRRVIAIPNRDHLLVTGSEDEEGLRMVASEIDELAQEPRFSGGDVYIQSEQGWSLWTPEEPSDVRAHYEMIAIQTLLMHEAGQRELLQELLVAEEKDVYMAGLNVVQNAETGKLTSWVSVADSIVSYLSAADFYGVEAIQKSSKRGGFFSRLRKKKGAGLAEMRLVAKGDFFRIAESYLSPVEGTFPELWEFRGELSGEVLSELTEASVGMD